MNGESRIYTENQPNLSYLKELSGGDAGFMEEIIEMFMSDAPKIVDHANDCFQKTDFDLLKVTVHKLKSSVQVLGNTQLALFIQDIESSAKNPDKKEQISQMLVKLEDDINSMMGFLAQELDSIRN